MDIFAGVAPAGKGPTGSGGIVFLEENVSLKD